MAPSLEENTVFNEGERKQELPAASRKASLFSFASFPLFMGGRREAGPIHPCSTASLGLIRGAPRPSQTSQTKDLHADSNPRAQSLLDSPALGYLPVPTLRWSGAGLVCRGTETPSPTTRTPGATHPAIQCHSLAIQEKPRHGRCVILTWHQV